MQIQILKPDADGKYRPNYTELIRNATDEDEREYLRKVREHQNDGFAFGIIYTAKQACGHYEIFQHPIYHEHGKEPTESDILNSLKDVIDSIEEQKSRGRKCTRCICGW